MATHQDLDHAVRSRRYPARQRLVGVLAALAPTLPCAAQDTGAPPGPEEIEAAIQDARRRIGAFQRELYAGGEPQDPLAGLRDLAGRFTEAGEGERRVTSSLEFLDRYVAGIEAVHDVEGLKALDRFPAARDRALAGLEDQGPNGFFRATLSWHLADIAWYLQEFDLALEMADAARDALGDSTHDRWVAVHVVDTRARTHLSLGRVHQAFELHDRSVEAMRELVAVTARPYVNTLDAVHLTALRLRAAIEDDEGVLEYLREEDPPRVGRNDVTFTLREATALLELGRDDPERLEQARMLLEGVVVHPEVIPLDRTNARLRLAELELLAGDLTRAAEHLREVRASHDEQEKVRPVAKARQVVLELRLARRRGADVGALGAELFAAWDDVLASWDSAPPFADGVGYLYYSDAHGALGAVLEQHLELRPGEAGVEAAFEELLRAQRRGTLLLELAPAWVVPEDVDLRRVRGELLGRGECYLVYLPGAERTHLFVLTGEEIVHVGLRSSRDIRPVARDLWRSVCTPPAVCDLTERGELIEAASRLLLPRSVQERIAGCRSLSIVGLDLLDYVPFEALVLEDGRPLGQAFAVAYVPSLPLEAALSHRAEVREAGASWGLDLCLLGGARHSSVVSDLTPLRLEGAGELDATAAHYAPGRVQRLVGEEATASRLSAACGRRPRTLHVVTHGTVDVSRDRMAGLVLTPEGDGDGRFWSEDAEALAAPPLTVLMACGSWRSRRRPGDGGVGHLGGAFLRAGSHTVVLPRADVEVGAMLVVTEALHRHLTAGHGPAEAMRRVRVELAADERYADPFYHSLLHVVGVGHRPVFEARSGAPDDGRRSFSIVSAILGVALLVAWGRARGAATS